MTRDPTTWGARGGRWPPSGASGAGPDRGPREGGGTDATGNLDLLRRGDGGGAERTRYQFGSTAESTYGYSPGGERIGAIIERGNPELAGHFVPARWGGCEVAESRGGLPLLYLDGVGYEANQVVEGVPALDGRGRYEEVHRS